MNPADAFRRYQELQCYVGWTDDAARQVASVAGLIEPHLPGLVDDFYAEIERHPDARKVITGGPAQIDRLKGTLVTWLRELFAGRYDADYVARRWRVGWRHVEIGLDQVYTNVALSRLRSGLVRALHEHWPGDPLELRAPVRSLNTLLDLDLAIIEDLTRRSTPPASSASSGWPPSGRSPAASPTSCATRSTSSRPRSITWSTPATPPPRRRPNTSTGSSGTSPWPTA